MRSTEPVIEPITQDAPSIIRADHVETIALGRPPSAVSIGLFLDSVIRELNLDVIAPETNKVMLRVRIVDYWLDESPPGSLLQQEISFTALKKGVSLVEFVERRDPVLFF